MSRKGELGSTSPTYAPPAKLRKQSDSPVEFSPIFEKRTTSFFDDDRRPLAGNPVTDKQGGWDEPTPGRVPSRRRTGLDLSYSEVLKAWSPEIISCVAGLAIFVGMVIILRVFNGKEQPSLALGLTINSALQYLTSFAKLAFVIPIIEGLGQLKWMWFKAEDRPLADFQLYEDATRGGLGSFKLLFRLRGMLKWPLLWIASVLIISGIFTSAVTQQVVTFETSPVPDPGAPALVARATRYSRWTGERFELADSDQLDLEHTILSTAFLSPSDTVPPIEPNCTTSDCSWPRFGSIGVCVDMANVTSTTNPAVQQIMYSIANTTINNFRNGTIALANPFDQRLFIAGGSPLRLPTGVFNPQNTAAALADIMFIYSKAAVDVMTYGLGDLEFVEAMFYFCTKSYDTVVSSGNKTTTQRDAVSRIIAGNATSLNAWWSPDKFNVAPQFTCKSEINGVTIQLEAPPGVTDKYEADLCTTLITSSAINPILSGFIAMREGDKGIGGLVGIVSAALGKSLYGTFLGQTPTSEERAANLLGMTRNIADGLTNMIRDKGDTYVNSSGIVRGRTMAQRPLVKVRWEWLALLAAQLSLAIVFLIGVIMATHNGGVQILKSSAIATLSVLDEPARQSIGPVGDPQELTEQAKCLRVRLQNKDSVKLVGVGVGPNQEAPIRRRFVALGGAAIIAERVGDHI